MSRYVRRNVRAMQGYTPGEQPADPNLVKLNTNENPYPPSPRVGEALRIANPAALRRYPDPLCSALRRRIGRLHGCSPDRIAVGNGSDELLALCVRAFVEPGRRIAFFDPTYSLYPVLAAAHGLETRITALPAAFGWTNPDVRDADLFFLARPNAPTGIAYPRETVRRFAASFDGVVVLDEAYADFSDDPMTDLAAAAPNVIAVRTLSKSYSLAGLRLGYAVGPPELIAAMLRIKDSYNVGALPQVLAAAALSDPAHMRDNVERVRRTRAAAARSLRNRGFSVTDSQANFLWVRPPAGARAAALFEALRRRGVLVRYFPGPRTDRYLRITVGTDEQMKSLFRALDAALRAAG